MADEQVERIRGYVARERDAALLYRRIAEVAGDDDRATLLRLAREEDQHADHWERVLVRLGADRPTASGRLRWSGRVALALGRRFGVAGAMPVLERREDREAEDYAGEPHAPDELLADEVRHGELVRGLAPTWREEVAGPIRAGVFGVSDGTVSNLALVLGVAGSGAGNDAIVTAGIAGLVAGAASMAVGEYVSVATHTEVLAASSEGPVSVTEARRAAVASLVTFAFGALVPLVPFILGSGTAATLGSLLAGGLLLFTVGATLSLLTLRPATRMGLRQLGLGWGAAALTWGVGSLVGITVA